MTIIHKERKESLWVKWILYTVKISEKKFFVEPGTKDKVTKVI